MSIMTSVRVKPVYNKEIKTLENGDKEVTIYAPDKVTGELTPHTYIDKPRVVTPKPSGQGLNGLTIESIRNAGNKISVHHFRAFSCSQLNKPKMKQLDKGIRYTLADKIIFLPKSCMHEGDHTLKLLPRGGYTRLHITILDEKKLRAADIEKIPMKELLEVKTGVFKRIIKSLHVMSRCANEEASYCYKTGVKDALDRLLASDVYLLNHKEIEVEKV